MHTLISFSRRAIASVLLSMLLVSSFANAQNKERAILILDASGSMAGSVDGKPKIEVAREVIREIVTGLDSSIELGLMAYGHRNKNDCADIELLIPPGPVDKPAFLRTVLSIQPKGMTPLTDAVVQSAEALKYTEAPTSVILVTDGVETCRKDPCAAAEKLAATGVGFKAHVIGFDLGSKALLSIECLATKTGGMFLAASDASSLKRALSAAVAAVAAPAAPEPPAATTGLLRLKTVTSEGGKPVSGVFYTVTDANGKSLTGGSGEFKLAPGKYEVSAQWGRASAKASVEIKVGETLEKTLILGAGILKLRAFAVEGGEEVGGYFHIFEYDQEVGGSRKEIQGGGPNSVKLPVGKYWIRAEWQMGQPVVVEQEATVVADVETTVDIILNAGILNPKPLATEGGEAVDAYYDILLPEKSLNGTRKVIASGGNPTFKLPAGPVIVRAKWGDVVVEQEAEVKAGAATDFPMVLNAGIVAIKCTGPKGEAFDPYIEILSLKKDLSGRQKVIATRRGGFSLPAGKYLARANAGNFTGETEIEVKAGERTESTIMLK